MKLKLSRGVGFLVLGLFFASISQAQIIRIVDESSQRPLADVFIVHENQQFASFSDDKGKADISEFPLEGIIIIQHPSYDNLQLTKQDIIDNNLVVLLKEGIQHYEGITVSANKWEQEKTEVPNEILSIKSEEMAFANPPTSAEVLSNSGQVYVQKSQLGGGSPTLRGFAANAVLLVVDGVRLNNAIYRSGNLQNVINIDPNILEQTEVVFGPGSVIYGSDALGGVMDFKTREPKWSFSGRTESTANGLLRYSSAANEKTGHFDFTISQEKIAYLGSISFTDFGDLRAGRRRSEAFEGFFERNFVVDRVDGQDRLVANEDPEVQRASGYNLINVLQKIRWRTSDRTDMTYSYFISTTSNIPRYDRLTQPLRAGSDSLLNAEWYYGPQTWQMHALKFNSYAPTNLFDQMQTTVSFQFYEESRHDRRFGDDRLRNRKEEVSIVTMNVDFEKNLNNGTFFYGVDGFFNDVNSVAQRRNLLTGETTSASTRYPNGGSLYYAIAAYGNYKWDLTKKLVLNTGARYSVVRLQASAEDEEAEAIQAQNLVDQESDLLDNTSLTNHALTGSLSLVFNPSSQTKLSTILSSGFRAPNIDDVGKVFEIDGDAIVIPNGELNPEYSYNQEIGIEQAFSNRLNLKVVAYHSWLTNAIVRDEVDFNGEASLTLDGEELALRSQVNARRARLYGGSILLNYNLNKTWKFSSSLNVNEGQETDTNEPLRHATPVFGRSSITYEKEKFQSEFFVDYHAAKSADNLPASEIIDKAYLYTDEGSPAWSTLNIRFAYTPSKYVRLESGMENMLDQHYRTYSSGISAPGRNIYFSVRGSL